jgi:nitronate monooxygenase/enoyl-[acyl-carrier protein] reductase II
MASSARLTIAASAAGALGSLSTTQMPVERVLSEVVAIRAGTDRPFAINFLVPGLNRELFDAVLAQRIPVISLALGDPGELVKQAHEVGSVVVHQVTTTAQASEAAERGVDVIIAQGAESGGLGGFVSTMALVPQVVDAVRPVPVVAAGGIADGRGLAALLLLGAEGANIGTRFLASLESPAADAWKHAIVQAPSEDAVKVDFWGAVMPPPAPGDYPIVPRSLRTPFIDRWTERPDAIAQNADAIRDELFAALPAGRVHEYVPFAGQSAGLVREILPVERIIRDMVAEAEELLRRAPALA